MVMAEQTLDQQRRGKEWTLDLHGGRVGEEQQQRQRWVFVGGPKELAPGSESVGRWCGRGEARQTEDPRMLRREAVIWGEKIIK